MLNWNRLSVLTPLVLSMAVLAGSCSLSAPHAPNGTSLRIRLDDGGVGKRPITGASGGSGGSGASGTGPALITDFNCFAINVSGGGIPTGALPNGGCSTSDNMQGRGVGITSEPVARGQTIELTVPGGNSRVIDVYGIFPPSSKCGGGGEATASNPQNGYFLGSVTQTLVSDTAVTIPISFAAGSTASLTCKGNAPPPAPVTPPPAAILGQASSTGQSPSLSATGMNTPSGIFSDGTHLAVADTANNRVLVWNTIPTTLGQTADLVLGQVDFTSGSANMGASTAISSLSSPGGLTIFGGKLLVADTNNNRILIWNTFPTTSGQNADVVVGQIDFISNASANASNGMSFPATVSVSPTGELYIASSGNNQVIYFSTIPTTNGAAAQFVIGQLNFTSTGTGSAANQLNGPTAAAAGVFGVAVADANNNRVVIFNTPAADNSSAIHVLGQASFGPVGSACTATSLNSPNGLFIKGSNLYVADTLNNRILHWNNVNPAVDGQAADHVAGQSNFTTCTNAATQTTLNGPISLFSDAANFLFAADSTNNRVTINNFF